MRSRFRTLVGACVKAVDGGGGKRRNAIKGGQLNKRGKEGRDRVDLP